MDNQSLEVCAVGLLYKSESMLTSRFRTLSCLIPVTEQDDENTLKGKALQQIAMDSNMRSQVEGMELSAMNFNFYTITDENLITVHSSESYNQEAREREQLRLLKEKYGE